jgi:2-polyprenyl-3-methyl-5-hydroxy-6-metoxy-1,4-benzoquinol methylase
MVPQLQTCRGAKIVTDEELSAAIRDVQTRVQERVRTRISHGAPGLNGATANELMALLHARDAAEAKVAAIGTVNPRPPGFKNNLIQSFKRFVARALDWHVREQVEFNRATMACVQATLEALTDVSRGLTALSAYQEELRAKSDERHSGFEQWRASFEELRNTTEIRMLRTVAELQSAYNLRASLIDQNFRDSVRQQHDDFTVEMDRRTLEIQTRLWQDMEKVKGEYDRLIHTELRLLRQRQTSVAPSIASSAAATPDDLDIDWMRFAEQFRGSEDRIREQQKLYIARFAGTSGVILDIGCGRGEFLEAAKAANLPARGIDLNQECVALCRSKGLDVEQSDMFGYLESLADGSLGGAYCAQVVEHLPPSALPRLAKLLSQKLRVGALVAIETPNPECLAIFATHFYIDPTHTRPVPAPLLRFYLQEAGFGSVQIERLAPAVESMPALAELPPAFRDAFFGGLDYAIFARKL